MALPKAIAFLLIACVTGTTTASNSRFSHLRGDPSLHSASAIVLDASGNLIYGKDVDTVRPIASITKLMTAMVVLDAGLDLDEKITVSQEDRDSIRMTGSRQPATRSDSATP
jgi:serine-type D-Ala-D-Ala endopeptidase (penicillin-binding protein 7)